GPDEDLGDALELFRRTHRPMAIVRNDKEKVLGLITLEDVLEEIVGDIEDEHDRPNPKVKLWRRRLPRRPVGPPVKPAPRPRAPPAPPGSANSPPNEPPNKTPVPRHRRRKPGAPAVGGPGRPPGVPPPRPPCSGFARGGSPPMPGAARGMAGHGPHAPRHP